MLSHVCRQASEVVHCTRKIIFDFLNEFDITNGGRKKIRDMNDPKPTENMVGQHIMGSLGQNGESMG